MNYDWQTDLRPRSQTALTFLPPAGVEETAWDILLALHSDRRCELALERLGRLVGVPERVLNQWLARLEDRRLILGVTNEVTHEVRAVLTPDGRSLLDRYFSAANELQLGRLR